LSPHTPQMTDKRRIAFKGFGVPISLDVGSAEVLSRVVAILPPGSRPCESVPGARVGDGLVHPNPKPLSIRVNGFGQTDHGVALLGGSVGTSAIPVGMIVFSVQGYRAEPAV
jgi:hypothetical protein